MAIKFKCPHCEKALAVKDELAGKKGSCPGCKKVIAIPAAPPAPVPKVPLPEGNGAATAQPAKAPTLRKNPTAKAPPTTKAPAAKVTEKPSKPPADLEAEAAALFADEPPPPEEVNPQFVEFQCPACDEKIKLSADLAGKRGQCPECRNLVKVPALEKKEAKDWRKVATGPSGARQNVAPDAAPDAWDTAAATTASKTALEEAGAVPKEREKLSLRQWLFRGGLAASLIIGFGSLGWWGYNLVAEGANEKAVKLALEMVKPVKDRPPVYSQDAIAEVKRAAGEYALSTNRRDCALRAKTLFGEARAALSGHGTSERDVLRIDLAVSQVDLGGSGDELDDGRRLPWDKARDEVTATLRTIAHPEAKVLALREVVRKLVVRQQFAKAVELVSQAGFGGDSSIEAQALVALELFRHDPKTAETLAASLRDKYPEPAKPGAAKDPARRLPPVHPALVALGLVVWEANEEKKGQFLRRLSEATNREVGRLGTIQALARQGKLTEAKQNLDGQPPLQPGDRLAALLGIAEAVSSENPEAAKPYVQEALALIETQLKKSVSPWIVYRLAHLAADCGEADKGQGLPAAVAPESGLHGQVQLQLVRGQMKKNEKADPEKLLTEDKNSIAYLLMWELAAKHNAGIDGGTLTTVRSWDEKFRPLGLVGAVLGRRGLE